MNYNFNIVNPITSHFVIGADIQLKINVDRFPEPDFSAESDYIYFIQDDGVHIVRYIGASLNPIIPTNFESIQTAALEPTAFTYSDIRSVIIPGGVTAIY